MKPDRSLRHDAFDIIDEDTAYWLGFLFADGCIRSQNNSITLRLTASDRLHVVKLREFLGTANRIGECPAGNFGGYKSRPSVRLAIHSRRLVSRNLELGRYEGRVSPQLTSSRHFWRGVTDGDGSVYISSKGFPVFEVCGSQRLLAEFLNFLKMRGLAARMTVRPSKSIYILGTEGWTVAGNIIEELYADAPVALDRKAAKAKVIVDLVVQRRAEGQVARARAEAELVEIQRLYESGASLVEVGRHFGVSGVAVLNRMRKAGIPRRPRQGGRLSQESRDIKAA